MAMKYSQNAYKNRAQNRESSGTNSSFDISEDLQKQLDEKIKADREIRLASGKEYIDYNDRSQEKDGQNFRTNKKFLDSVYKNIYANATRDPNTGEAEAFKGRGVKAKTAAAMEQRDDAVTQLKIDHPEYFAGKRPENSFSVDGFANHKDQLKILGLDDGGVDKELAAKMLGVVKVAQEAAWDASDMDALYTSKKGGSWLNLNSRTTPVPKRSTVFPDEAVNEFKKNLSKQGDANLLDDLNNLRKEAGMKGLSMANFALAAHRGRYADVKDNALIANNHLGNKQRDYSRGWQELETKATEHNVELNHDVRTPSYAEGNSQKELAAAIQTRSHDIDEGLSSLVEKDEGRKKVLNYISKYAKGITELDPDDIKNRDKLVEAVKGFAKQNGDGKWVASKNRDEAADTIISIAKNINERNALTIEHIAKDPDIRNREEGNGVFTDNAAKAQRDLIRDLGMTKSSADERRNVLTAINQFASAEKDFKDPNNLIGQLVEKNGGDASLSRQNISDAIEDWNFQKSSNNFAIIKRYQSVLPEGKEYNPEESKREYKKTRYPGRGYNSDDMSDVTDEEDSGRFSHRSRARNDKDHNDKESEDQELRRQVRTLTRQVSLLQETLETNQVIKSDDRMDADSQSTRKSGEREAENGSEAQIAKMVEKALEKFVEPLSQRLNGVSDRMSEFEKATSGNDRDSSSDQNSSADLSSQITSNIEKAVEKHVMPLFEKIDGLTERLLTIEEDDASTDRGATNQNNASEKYPALTEANIKAWMAEAVQIAVKEEVDPLSKKVEGIGGDIIDLNSKFARREFDIGNLEIDMDRVKNTVQFNTVRRDEAAQLEANMNKGLNDVSQTAHSVRQQASAAYGSLEARTGSAVNSLAEQSQFQRHAIDYVNTKADTAGGIGVAAHQRITQDKNDGSTRRLQDGSPAAQIDVVHVSDSEETRAIEGPPQSLSLPPNPPHYSEIHGSSSEIDKGRAELMNKESVREGR